MTTVPVYVNVPAHVYRRLIQIAEQQGVRSGDLLLAGALHVTGLPAVLPPDQQLPRTTEREQLAARSREPVSNRGKGARLTPADRARIAELHADGMNVTDIARLVGCARDAVRRWANG